jgi:protein gp37
MGKTKIEWADSVWNPVTGCTPISEGCRNCYAQRMSKRLAGRCGYPADEPFKVTLHPDRFDEPLKWKKPRRVFACSMGDLFHEDVPNEFIDYVFAVMGRSQQHTFILLTKRPERMREYLQAGRYQQILNIAYRLKFRPEGLGKGIDNPKDMRWWPNVWLGVTAENQQRADERIPILLEIPAAKRFVSVEPMLELINIIRSCDVVLGDGNIPAVDGINRWLHWIICGGETGPGARPVHPDWVRSLRDQCIAANVPFFFKSWGKFCYPDQMPDDTYRKVDAAHNLAGHGDYDKPWRVGKKAAGRILDGREWNEVPNYA